METHHSLTDHHVVMHYYLIEAVLLNPLCEQNLLDLQPDEEKRLSFEGWAYGCMLLNELFGNQKQPHRQHSLFTLKFYNPHGYH